VCTDTDLGSIVVLSTGLLLLLLLLRVISTTTTADCSSFLRIYMVFDS
jgi:hypothetical protein